MDTITLTADDGAQIDVLIWRPDCQPRGFIQLVHGFAEYAARYDEFARCLAQSGWLVVANDHRGHGPRALVDGTLGQAPDRGYHQIVDDLCRVTDDVRSQHPKLPWILVGHSMGSFLARIVAARRGREMTALVLLGTGASAGPLAKVARGAATSQIVMAGEDSASRVMETLIFGSMNLRFRPVRTRFDWLSRQASEVDAYCNDPLCGFTASVGLYRELVRLSETSNSSTILRAIPPRLPVLLMSGDSDPVGGNGRGVRRVAGELTANGVLQVDVHLVPDARHELLHERDREQTYRLLETWIGKTVEARSDHPRCAVSPR